MNFNERSSFRMRASADPAIINFLLLLVSIVIVSQPARAQEQCDQTPILIRGAHVWSPSGPSVIRDVLFENDRLVSIAPAGSIVPSQTARVIDGKGQTLLPGLIDLHLHFGVPGGLPDATPPARNWQITGRQLLRSGVTTGRIHMMSLQVAALLKRDALNPCAPLPRLQFAGPEISGGIPDTETPNFTGVRNPDDAVVKVQRVADARLQWTAISDVGKFAPAELLALTAAARNSEIRLMGPVSDGKQISPLLSAGVDTIDDGGALSGFVAAGTESATRPDVGSDHRLRVPHACVRSRSAAA